MDEVVQGLVDDKENIRKQNLCMYIYIYVFEFICMDARMYGFIHVLNTRTIFKGYEIPNKVKSDWD